MKSIVLAATVALAALASTAHAESDKCGNVPKDKWMTEDAIREKAKGMGYDVRKIKIEDGCYEVYAIDAKGSKVESLFNPETGAVVGQDGDD
ncbi:PepSY domain-containing protein [Rhizobium alvei]|uniref:PepSY domain-containing protein n=1 Tax=Rhizobium alvei TaxID=1132659 RepID=A0ABT8YKW8_9HYPH|nr:PepSY domain-containing protein [Rhizobium alvei]MDO6964335.1 PepSY domain-containing protein [Rhizobium alvei]